jgi:two-component system, OmpR family, alkaline phosphatase synthesis response regulator PhoP
MAQKILVVDDEPDIVEIVRYNLEKSGYQVLMAGDGGKALGMARSQHPDLVVLDVMMPGIDGLEVCAILRRETDLPIILLTARDSETDKVVGLEMGADDYLTKPFSPRELLARIKAVLRRTKTVTAGAGAMRSGELELDLVKHEARRCGKPLALTAKEFTLLEFLMQHTGIALARQAILDHVWGYDYYGDPRTVDVHIRRLREKVEADPHQPRLISTVPGLGYRFEELPHGEQLIR